MSYTRSFERTISVPYSGTETVHYPASKSGGYMTVHYSGTAHEDVTVRVHVDTDPFDSSVDDCTAHVNGLTASVGAMNAAQCVAIADNAEKVSKSIIDGFFHTIRTDLGTQKAELEQAVNARLILLRQQAETLQEKRKNMETDYARTAARYQKLFADLNKELDVRIREIDQPIFRFVEEIDSQSDRMLHTDMIQTAVTMSKESSILQAQISAAAVKHHALQTMSQVHDFLISKARSEKALRVSCIEGDGNERYLVPVCYMKTESENQQIASKCYIPDYYAAKNKNMADTLCERLENMDLDMQEFEPEQLKSYVQNEIAAHIKDSDSHSVRVREMINKLLNK